MIFFSIPADAEAKAQLFSHIRLINIAIGIFAFIIAFIWLYTPSANVFDMQSHMAPMVIASVLIGIFSFGILTVIAAIFLLPARIKGFAPQSSHTFSAMDSTSTRSDDWYNDSTNPASSVHQSIDRSLHQ